MLRLPPSSSRRTPITGDRSFLLSPSSALKNSSRNGQDAEGAIITQVMPPYDRSDYPTVALYRKCLAKYSPGEAPTFVSLEGFVDAMVLVEGLKRAGKELTRERFISAIESIHEMNAGLGPKLILNYSTSDHKGFDNVYPTIVKNGLPLLLTDWSNISK